MQHSDTNCANGSRCTCQHLTFLVACMRRHLIKGTDGTPEALHHETLSHAAGMHKSKARAYTHALLHGWTLFHSAIVGCTDAPLGVKAELGDPQKSAFRLSGGFQLQAEPARNVSAFGDVWPAFGRARDSPLSRAHTPHTSPCQKWQLLPPTGRWRQAIHVEDPHIAWQSL